MNTMKTKPTNTSETPEVEPDRLYEWDLLPPRVRLTKGVKRIETNGLIIMWAWIVLHALLTIIWGTYGGDGL